MLNTINQLFLTENIISYLMLLILSMLIFIIGARIKYGVLVAVPTGLLASVFYLTNGLGWHFLILLFSSISVMFIVATKNR